MDMHFQGVVFQTHAAELARRIERPWPPFAVLDVRGREAHDKARIPGAVPYDVSAEAGSLPTGTTADTELFVVGGGPTDGMVRLASTALRELGVQRIVEVPGGFYEWKQLGLPVEAGPGSAAATAAA